MKTRIDSMSRSLDWSGMNELAQSTIETAIALQQIPAPSFHEEQRARYVCERFRALGLEEVSIDDRFNAYGLVRGSQQKAPALMVMAHTDTVFAAHTDLTLRREPRRVYGPGLGDNSIGVAALIELVTYLHARNHQPAGDIWLVATSCEEGLGDLRGVRAAYDNLRGRVRAVINIEGMAFGHIYHAGIAVQRLKITASADGGHSWLHFGRPSAVHGIARLGAEITRIPVRQSPRTTYNIGMISGGEAINAIATHAELWLDLRSEDSSELSRLREAVEACIRATRQPGLRFTSELVGDRPSGRIDIHHPLVEAGMAALATAGVQGALERGSTDGNIPLQDGCPTITIGITRGANAHRLDEYIETEPVAGGMKQLITLALTVSEHLAAEGRI